MILRTCPVLGLKRARQRCHRHRLFPRRVIAALLVVLTRWQAVHLLSPVWYYRVLTAHGLMLIFILFFEMAVLYFAGPILLNCRLPAPKVGWAAYGLMLIGTLMVEYYVWTGKADVLFTSYVPLRADPGYYLGIILFAVGALAVTFLFLTTMVVAKRERTYEGSVPLVTFGALTAAVIAVIAVIALVHGAAIYIPTFLWSLNLMSLDAEVYRIVWWGLGHSSQQINVAAHVACWYLLAGLTVGGVVLNEKVSRTAYVLYVLMPAQSFQLNLLPYWQRTLWGSAFWPQPRRPCWRSASVARS